MNEEGSPADTVDDMPEVVPDDVGNGGAENEESESAGHVSFVSPGSEELEPEAKNRKLANINRSKARITQVLSLQKYDGSMQKMTKMVPDLEFGENREKNEEVIIEKLTDRKDMSTPHGDEKWADKFRNTVFVGDVNGGIERHKHMVIEARKTESEFFSLQVPSPMLRNTEARLSARGGTAPTPLDNLED